MLGNVEKNEREMGKVKPKWHFCIASTIGIFIFCHLIVFTKSIQTDLFVFLQKGFRSQSYRGLNLFFNESKSFFKAFTFSAER